VKNSLKKAASSAVSYNIVISKTLKIFGTTLYNVLLFITYLHNLWKNDVFSLLTFLNNLPKKIM
jgi:hypothetical protein